MGSYPRLVLRILWKVLDLIVSVGLTGSHIEIARLLALKTNSDRGINLESVLMNPFNMLGFSSASKDLKRLATASAFEVFWQTFSTI